MLHPPQAPASSAKTSIRSAHDGALATAHEWKIANMSGKMVAVVVCSNILPILGGVVALVIYAILQKLDEPQKQKELFEEACNEAFAKIEPNADKNQKTMTYSTSNGCTVTYTEKSDGLYLQKSFNGVMGTEEKHHFQTLAELQQFRRKDLSSEYSTLYGEKCPDDLKPLWRMATLYSKLSQHVGAKIEPEVLGELKDLHSLVPKDIEAAYACLMGVEKKPNQFIDGLQLMKLAILHNTLSKIGSDHNEDKADSEVFGEEALKNYMNVYNLENAYQSKADEFMAKTGRVAPSEEKLKDLCDLNLAKNRGDRAAYDKFFVEHNLDLAHSDELVALYSYQKHEVKVETLRALPKLEEESIKIMLAIEKEKFNPANANERYGEPDSDLVNAAVNKLVHDTFRPGETGDDSEIVDISTKIKQEHFTHDEIKLWENLNAGTYSPGTSCRMIGSKRLDAEVKVAEFRPLHPALKLALSHSYKNPDPIRQTNLSQSANPENLHTFINLFGIYTNKTDKPKYDALFSRIYAVSGTLNVYDGQNARNGLFN